LTFDPSLLLSYIFAVFILIFICLNEQWYEKIQPLFEKVLFSKKNPYIKEDQANLIKTFKEDIIEKNNITIKNYATSKSNKKVNKGD
jgi:hypothetical protein